MNDSPVMAASARTHRQVTIVAGAITTLGRGGSDLTATVIGAALGLEEVQVWKDVDGTFPRIKNLPHLGAMLKTFYNARGDGVEQGKF